MRKIELLIKPTSYLCNLDCIYCFYKKTKLIYPNAKRMEIQTLEKLISSAMDYSDGGEAFFCWQGGEPLLAGIDFYKKVVEFQMKYGKRGQIVGNSIQTNGILINEEWIEFFKKYKFFVGISLDGPPEIHNFYRKDNSGKGSFDNVIKSVNLLKREGVEFNILSTLGKETGRHPEKIFNFFISKGLPFLQFIPAVDRRDEKMFEFSMNSEIWGNFLCKIFDKWWNNGNPCVSVRFFDNILEVLCGLPPTSCAFKKRCGEYLVIEHNGDVYPCDFFVNPEFKVGNIFENNFEELLYLSREKFGKLKLIGTKECKECEWNFICNNGCLWFRWVKEGDFFMRDCLCDAYKKFFSYSFNRIKSIARMIVNKLNF